VKPYKDSLRGWKVGLAEAWYFEAGVALALSQRLSPLGLIFRSSTPTTGKIILINFRISLLKYIKLINYYSRHYAFSKLLYL
jgi:hypothetical protein